MGKYKHGKPNEEITLAELQGKLKGKRLSVRRKAYVILLYWLGCRRSEPLVLRKEDIEQHGESLFISIHYRMKDGEPIKFSRGKKGQCGGPVELNLKLWGADKIKEVWQKTRRKRKIFPFSSKTAYRIIKNLWPKRSPHWLRYQRVTKLRRKRDLNLLSIDEIKSFTGIRRDSTIEGYGLKTKADIHKVAQQLD